MLDAIRARIPDRARSATSSPSRRRRSSATSRSRSGIPLYGADPRLLPFGTKTGCRRLFAEAGVPHPLGWEDLRDVDGVVDALAQMRAANARACTQAIVKLNEGVAAGATRSSTSAACRRPVRRTSRRRCARALERWRSRASRLTLDDVPAAHWRTAAASSRSASRARSCAARACSCASRRCGEVEILSTHDQLLGGPSGQSYLGCRFPADFAYARRDHGRGARRSARGSRTRACSAASRSTSSSCATRDGGWTPYAIELNLRKGGTTHPFLTLQFLTDGAYDPAPALFTAPNGREKYLVAATTSSPSSCAALSVDDLFDIAVRHRLHFHQARQIGTVFHMLSAVTELGRTG